MAIKRYTASQDAPITNTFLADLRTRATGSNAGLADTMPIFSIYAQSSSASTETCRTLWQFPTDQISADRVTGTIPASGSVNFLLRLYNAPHAETVPRNFILVVQPVSRSWDEGRGIDTDNWTDLTSNLVGCNWINAASGTQWSNAGGDYLTGSSNLLFSQSFTQGTEDMLLDVTTLVEAWLNGSTPNNGILVALTGSQESGSASNYVKKFFARSSEFFFKRPMLEARWNSSIADERAKFFFSSSLLSSTDNTHTIYFYNYVKGTLKNIPQVGTGPIYVQLYASASGQYNVATVPNPVTGGLYVTGVYSASFSIPYTSQSTCYDIWYSGSTVQGYFTGTIVPLPISASDSRINFANQYITSLPNFKSNYANNEISRIRVFIRPRSWNPNIYNIASTNVQTTTLDNVFYKVVRESDGLTVIDYGTGSLNHTLISYDNKGNYFDLDMSLFEPGYGYYFRFMFKLDSVFSEQPGTFKFRVMDVNV